MKDHLFSAAYGSRDYCQTCGEHKAKHLFAVCACGHTRDQHTSDGSECGVSSKPGDAHWRAPYVPCPCTGFRLAGTP